MRFIGGEIQFKIMNSKLMRIFHKYSKIHRLLNKKKIYANNQKTLIIIIISNIIIMIKD